MPNFNLTDLDDLEEKKSELNAEDDEKYAESAGKKQIVNEDSYLFIMLPELIKEMWRKGFPISFNTDKEFSIEVADFYNSKTLILTTDREGNIFAKDKSGDRGQITSLEDVIQLNYYWWVMSKNRQGFYPLLTKFWADEFRKRNYVRREYCYFPVEEALASLNK